MVARIPQLSGCRSFNLGLPKSLRDAWTATAGCRDDPSEAVVREVQVRDGAVLVLHDGRHDRRNLPHRGSLFLWQVGVAGTEASDRFKRNEFCCRFCMQCSSSE